MEFQKIPKKIHYCWFGSKEKDLSTMKCIESWKSYCPDYEIIEWNENNYDFTKNEYVKEAYTKKKWAFVSDYVRLDVIYKYGGVYLDCDVEVIKNFDTLLSFSAFFGFESETLVNTGQGFGSISGNPIVKSLLDDYENIQFIDENGVMDLTPCPVRNTETLKKRGLITNGQLQCLGNTVFLPKEFSSPKDNQTGDIILTSHTYMIHHFNGSWVEKNVKRKQRINRFLIKLLGKKNFIKIKEKARIHIVKAK